MKQEVQYKENTITVQEYLYLRDSVHWVPLSLEQAERALENSIYTVCAYDNGKPVGMGRMVGDGVVIVYVQDPGTQLMLDLMCAKGREQFYSHMGFLARPTETLGPGMIMYLREED